MDNKIKYDIILYDDKSFDLLAEIILDDGLFDKAMISAFKKFSISPDNEKTKGTFEIEPQFYKKISNALDYPIKKIEKELIKENKIKKIIYYDVKKAKLVRTLNTSIVVNFTGVYM